MRVDNRALPICPLIELPYAMLAEQRQIVLHFIQVLAGPDFFAFPEIRSPRHSESNLTYSFFVRHQN